MFTSSWRSAAAERIFNSADKDGDGLLSVDELVEAPGTLRDVRPPVNRVQSLMDKFDANGDGRLDIKMSRPAKVGRADEPSPTFKVVGQMSRLSPVKLTVKAVGKAVSGLSELSGLSGLSA